jgi:primosomal protein N' (replication factor Y)
MVLLRVQGRDAGRTREQALALGGACREKAAEAVTVLGPIEAPIGRLADHYRWQVILKAPAMAPLQRLIRQLMAATPWFASREVRIFIDVDPYFLL